MMPVAEYKAKLLSEVGRFFEFWERSNRNNPDDFPGAMPNEAEWDEQFRIWQDSQDE